MACRANRKTPGSVISDRKHGMNPTHAIILDFESTCDQGRGFGPHEIIEFPSVLVDLETDQVVDDFKSFARPVENPVLTEFCTQLTSITQQDVEGASLFTKVFGRHQAWLEAHHLTETNALFVTCGDWDLMSMLPQQCQLSGIDPAAIPPIYRRWLNIKVLYCQVLDQPRVGGMKKMLNGLGLKLEGTHHRGIDDCRNIGRILLELKARGGEISITGSHDRDNL